eukprot:GHVN01106208.1.p1 GENE.GHVN01106208.1~~GHVN01106208.1.p1  ORF type:complete len:271 (+),score=42.08 GHVN01106208.1:988-1800(+)
MQPYIDNILVVSRALESLKAFYTEHAELSKSKSHGLEHALAVYHHTLKAIDCIKQNTVSMECSEDIQLASLLHDVDDKKYSDDQQVEDDEYPNATRILAAVGIDKTSLRYDNIIYMIDLVSCSKNGNTVPQEIEQGASYHLLIPRWADRLEAVGCSGVVRCYQYTLEKKIPLWGENSPKPISEEDVWRYATAERFEEYQKSGGTSKDMISHYYDKLLHVARPPKEIVRNAYLEKAAEKSSAELVEICLRFGKSGDVDINYILNIERLFEK